MKIYISLPKKYDKTEVTFERVPSKKRQRAIKISKTIKEDKDVQVE